MSLDELRARYPWPATKPAADPEDHGWFQQCSRNLLGDRITPGTRLIVELGSWLGQSTRWLLERAPQATIIAVDTWEGGPDHHHNAPKDPTLARLLPVLYEKFCVNMWAYRDRLIPMRSRSVDGLLELWDRCGLEPDLIYIDADHTTKAVIADIATATTWFPDAKIVGDDWCWETVRAGVEAFVADANECGREHYSIVVDQNAWALEKA